MIEKKAQGGSGAGQQKNLLVYSEDQSVEVRQEKTASDDFVDLSVPLATESSDGRESALDKRVHDHSIANVAHLAHADDEDEALAQLSAQDPQYYPQEGQFLGWTDNDGNIHLSRYHALNMSNFPNRAWWISACYDEVHNSWCVLSGSDNQNNHGTSTNFMCATTFDNGLSWSVYTDPLAERWKWIEAGNGYICGISGNSSKEIYYSTDGGLTFTKKIIHDRHWYKIRYDKYKQQFVLVGEEEICVTSDFSTFTYSYDLPDEVAGKPINDIAFLSYNNVAYLYVDSGEFKISVAYGSNGTSRKVFTFDKQVDQMNVDAHGDMCICVYRGETETTNDYIYFFDLDERADKEMRKLDFSVNRGDEYATGLYDCGYPIFHAFPCGRVDIKKNKENYDYQRVIYFCNALYICRGYVNLKSIVM